MKTIWRFLAHAKPMRTLAPTWLKSFIRRHWSLLAYDKYMWSRSDLFSKMEPIPAHPAQPTCVLGIIKEFAHSHSYYIAACRELKVPYQLVDLSVNDWIGLVQNSNCAAFLVWPSPVLTIWKEMYDERVKIMVEDLGKIVYPSPKEIWLNESKRRVRDWLLTHGIPHPQTWIFYDLDEAMNFLDTASFPLVFKSNFGASANGVKLLKSSREARRVVRKAFAKGIVVSRGDPRDRQWGSVILQEYVLHTVEWRMVRVGDYYFCRLKRKRGDFASGSDLVEWAKPSPDLLELMRHLTNTGNFTSMNADIFETQNGRYLVNELHPFFGAISPQNEKKINENTGRYVYFNETAEWSFEKGYFYQNACANLRIEYLMKHLAKQ